MSNVSLTIGGRHFAFACADGEEGHIAELGAMIDARLREVGGAAMQSESRMLLFAALILADELHEARRTQTEPAAPTFLAERLDAIADALEKCALRLEGEAANA